MAVAEFKEAIGLLFRMPLLWIPGIVGGLFAAIIWLTLFVSGAFYTGRLFILFALALLFFITGIYSLISTNTATIRALAEGGLKYYFRVLLPHIVLGFVLLLVFILCTVVFSLLGLGSDIGMITALTFGILVPTLMLTFFFDTAAVFEDRKVFESLQRSVLLVSENMMDVLSFFIIAAFVTFGVIFGLMIVWEAILFDKLKPIMDFTEAQREAFTPDQLLSMIGQDGIWVTAAVIFIGVLILLPVLFSFKACFYRKMAGSTPAGGQPAYGEYDSKGRWYKY